jgi:hypothetical protein
MDVIKLKLLLQLEAVSVDKLCQGEPSDLGSAGEPTRADELLDLLGQLLRDIDLESLQGALLPGSS